MFNRVAIIGVGLLGGSFGLALKEKGLAKTVVGVTRRDVTAEQALKVGAVDEIAKNSVEAVKDADLILIATPMLTMERVLEEIADHIPANAILTDVGSVKSSLVDILNNRFTSLRSQFVLAHPIAGGEKHSVSAARADLFVGKHLILTDTDQCNADYAAKVEDLWVAIGSNVMTMSSSEHDAVFAYTSHLPHVIAYALVNNLHQQENNKDLFNFASAGFYDFTRIASSDPIMWRDICLSNKTEVLKSLKGFTAQLNELEAALEASDGNSLVDVFSDAKKARDMGLIAKNK